MVPPVLYSWTWRSDDEAVDPTYWRVAPRPKLAVDPMEEGAPDGPMAVTTVVPPKKTGVTRKSLSARVRYSVPEPSLRRPV